MNDIRPIRQAIRTAAFDEALAEHLGMNPTDLRCLELLVEEPGLTPGRLATAAGLTTGAITGVLDRLERGGFVARQADPADRRRVSILAVPERVAELVASVTPLDDAIGAALAGYDEAQRTAIAGFLGDATELVAGETARIRAEARGGFVGDTYRAPLGEATRGRLGFVSGAPRMALNVAPLGPRAAARVIMETSASRLEFVPAAPAGDLVVARFVGPRPDVRAVAGSVDIRYRREPGAAFTARHARIALNGDVPWTIELHGGLTDLKGTLDGVRLERLDVGGGTNHVDLELPRPRGTVVVRLGGVASSVRFRRPTGVPVAVRIDGGVSHLTVDGRRGGQVSGKRRYVGPGFEESPDRYEFEILRGASTVLIGDR